MKMSKMEKKFVNSKRHAQENLRLVEGLFDKIDVSNVRSVLEIGCGVGVVSAHLANEYDMDITGIDLDPEQIVLAKMHNEENERLRFIEADAKRLPFGNEEFDMVLSIYVLHHVNDWGKALEEICRVIQQDGYFLFNDLAVSEFTARIFRPLVKKYAAYTIDEIIQCLRGYGFKIVHSEITKGSIMKNYGMVFHKDSA
jgi:ubiquinone/menaquinone biosynthesis C-methylase UbiE